MTTPAKVQANRRNAKLSTGPRTAAGKAAVARNAIGHGIFASLPVLAGESPHDWDQHRTGIVSSLAPVGLMEINLAERVALLLWRFTRVSRAESGITNAFVEDAGLLPPQMDPILASIHPPVPDPEDYLKQTDQQLRIARVNHAEVLAVSKLLFQLGESHETRSYRKDHVTALFGWAFGETYDYAFRRTDPKHPSEPEFLAQIGVGEINAKEIEWTQQVILRGLEYYAGIANETAARFRTHLQTSIDNRVAVLERETRRLEADATAIVRRAENRRARVADASLLLPENISELLIRYEKHIQSQLITTLNQLERMQARRSGTPVAPPMIADVQLTVK